MVAPFKGKRNEYQCPFCGRYASEPNRYCSECFLVNPDQPGKPGSINVLMKPPHSNKPIAMVQLAAAIVVGFLLLTGAFVIWDKYQPGTIPFTFKKDEPAETQPIGEGLPYQKPPTPPWVSNEKADNSKPAVPNPGQLEAPTVKEGAETNNTPAAQNATSGEQAENTSDKVQGQMGPEGTETHGIFVTGENRSTKSTQTDLIQTPDPDNPTNKSGTNRSSGNINLESEIKNDVRE